MTVYKSFLSGIRANILGISIMTVIFLAITVVQAFNMPSSEADFISSKPEILLIKESGENPAGSENTLLSDAIEAYLKRTSLLTVTDKLFDDAIIDVEKQKASLLVRIPSDIADRLKNGVSPLADVYYTANTAAGSLANVNLEKYMMFLAAYYKANGVIDTAAVERAMESGSKITMASGSSEYSKDSFFRVYVVFLHYILIQSALVMLLPIMSIFYQDNIRIRMMVSSAKPANYLWQIVLGIITFFAFFLAFFLIVGAAFVGFDISFQTLAVVVADMVALSITLSFMVVALGSMNMNPSVVPAVANTLSLVSAFTSGIFVSSTYLPNAVVTFSKFLPIYHSVVVVRNTSITAEFFARHVGIQLLFSLVFGLMALYFGRAKRSESGARISTPSNI